MGADYEGQVVAIQELSALSSEAKKFLQHHITNPLAVILGAAQLGQMEMIKPQVEHIVDDLILAGIRDKEFKFRRR